MSSITSLPNSLFKFEPLTATNWLAWKCRVCAMLRKKKLLNLIKGEKPSSRLTPADEKDITMTEQVQITAWDDADGQARTIIEMSIGDKEMIHLSGANTALQMWEQLLLVKESRGRIGILVARRRMYRTYAKEGTDIVEHITEYQKMQEELHMMGSLDTDEDFSMLLLSSLPESWDQFTSAYLGVIQVKKSRLNLTSSLLFYLKNTDIDQSVGKRRLQCNLISSRAGSKINGVQGQNDQTQLHQKIASYATTVVKWDI